jgi:hypothetical protein
MRYSLIGFNFRGRKSIISLDNPLLIGYPIPLLLFC